MKGENVPSSDDIEEIPVGWNRTAISRKTLFNVFFFSSPIQEPGGQE